jgi:hypothetical protein
MRVHWVEIARYLLGFAVHAVDGNLQHFCARW